MITEEDKDKLIATLTLQLQEKEEEYQSFKKIADENVNYLKNRILEETRNHNQDKIELLEKVKDYFCEECEDGDGIKTGDWTITKDACEVAEYIDALISEIKGENK